MVAAVRRVGLLVELLDLAERPTQSADGLGLAECRASGRHDDAGLHCTRKQKSERDQSSESRQGVLQKVMMKLVAILSVAPLVTGPEKARVADDVVVPLAGPVVQRRGVVAGVVGALHVRVTGVADGLRRARRGEIELQPRQGVARQRVAAGIGLRAEVGGTAYRKRTTPTPALAPGAVAQLQRARGAVERDARRVLPMKLEPAMSKLVLPGLARNCV